MNALKIYCTFEDMNNYIRTKVDPKYKNSTFIPIKAEVNELDLSIDVTLVEANSLESRDGRRFRLELSPQCDDYSGITLINKICKSDEDHQWECCGVSTAGSTYRCKICGAFKSVPNQCSESTTISTYFNNKEK